jgi:glutathione S-transferase
MRSRPPGERDWALGSYSIADMHLFRLVWRLRNTLNPGPGESRAWSRTTTG